VDWIPKRVEVAVIAMVFGFPEPLVRWSQKPMQDVFEGIVGPWACLDILDIVQKLSKLSNLSKRGDAK